MNEKCKECNAAMVNTPSGQFSICPNGHGKLHPPVMPKPFDVLEVPVSVASCPECPGIVLVECNEWTLLDGISRPTQAGLLIYCANDDPHDIGSDESEEDDHNYALHLWLPTHMNVYKWLEAVK